MQLIIDTYKNTGGLHHGYCIEGERNGVYNRLCEFLGGDFNIALQGNPDFVHEQFDVLGIDDARKLKEMHASKPITERGKRVFAVEANSITREAQNSLLKIFEEPGEGNHFFLLLPRADHLLPTLKSRLIIIENEDQVTLVRGGKFLAMTPSERMSDIKVLLEQEEGAKQSAIELLQELEIILHGYVVHEPSPEVVEALRDLVTVKEYLQDRSSSVKMILEHLALVLPVIKIK